MSRYRHQPLRATGNAFTCAWLSCSWEHSCEQRGAVLPRRARWCSVLTLHGGFAHQQHLLHSFNPLPQVHAAAGSRLAAHLLQLHTQSRARCMPQVARLALRLGHVACCASLCIMHVMVHCTLLRRITPPLLH